MKLGKVEIGKLRSESNKAGAEKIKFWNAETGETKIRIEILTLNLNLSSVPFVAA